MLDQKNTQQLNQTEINDLSNTSLVKIQSLDGYGSRSLLHLEDRSTDSPDINSTYRIVVWRVSNQSHEWLGEKKLSRSQLKLKEKMGVLLIHAGVKEKTLDQLVTSRVLLAIDVYVQRSSPLYLGSTTIFFKVSKQIFVL